MRIRVVVLEAVAVLAETGWIYAGALVLAAIADGGRPPSFLALVLTAGLAFSLIRFMRHVDTERGWLPGAFAVFSVVAVYAIARADFAASLRVWDLAWLSDLLADPEGTLRGRGWLPTGIAILALCWIRNAIRALSPITFDGVLRSFSIGFGILLISVLAADPIDKPDEVMRLLLPVFAANLLALALAQSLRVDVEGHGASRASWFALVVGVVAGVVGLSLLLGVVAEALLSDAVQPAGEVLRTVVAAIVYAVSLPVFFLVYGLLRLVLFLSGRSEKDIAETLDLANQNLREVLTNPEPAPGAGPPEWVLVAFRAFQLAVAVAILGVVLALIYRRVRRADSRTGEARESVFSRGALRRDIGSLVGSLFGRRGEDGAERAASAIGRLYGDIVAEAQRRGVERDPALTPAQFAPQLFVAFESRVPLEVTEHFTAFAYGRVEPPREVVKRLRAGWDGIVEVTPR